MDATAYHFATAALVFMFVPATLFVLIYGLLVRGRGLWRWHMIGVTATFALYSGAAIARRIWGEWSWFHEFVIVVAFAAGCLIWHRLAWLVWASFIRPARARGDDPHDPTPPGPVTAGPGTRIGRGAAMSTPTPENPTPRPDEDATGPVVDAPADDIADDLDDDLDEFEVTDEDTHTTR